jgi:multidrug efflux pump subunit AcrB
MHRQRYPAAEINGAPAPGYSPAGGESDGELASENVPKGMTMEWTDLTFSEYRVPQYVFPLCILVFLVLAAQ